MATVKMSGGLRDKIKGRAHVFMSAPIYELEKERLRIATTYGDMVYENMLGHHKDTISSISTDWFEMVDEIDIIKVRDIEFVAPFKLTNKRPWPKYPENLVNYAYTYTHQNTFELIDDPHTNKVWDELYEEVSMYTQKLIKASQERYLFVESVTKIVNAHNTLAAALRAWPPLWDFVPENTKDKHREVKEKVRKEAVVCDVDLDRLTSVAVTRKLGV